MNKQEKSRSKDHKKVEDPEQSRRAAEILKNGGVVIFPTDTIYGIGCRYDDKNAVDRIYKIKSRSKNQPFPILVSSIEQVKQLATITQAAQELIEKYWPGGLTIVLNPKEGSQKIGFRMPRSTLIGLLINLLGKPIIGTSANFHGQKSPASFEELDPKIIKLADFAIRGSCKKGTESTVIDATINPPKIIRLGAVKISKAFLRIKS